MVTDSVPVWLRQCCGISRFFPSALTPWKSVKVSTSAARWTDLRILPPSCRSASGRLLDDLMTANTNGFGLLVNDCIMNVGYPVFNIVFNLRDNRCNTRPINEPFQDEHRSCRQRKRPLLARLQEYGNPRCRLTYEWLRVGGWIR